MHHIHFPESVSVGLLVRSCTVEAYMFTYVGILGPLFNISIGVISGNLLTFLSALESGDCICT